MRRKARRRVVRKRARHARSSRFRVRPLGLSFSTYIDYCLFGSMIFESAGAIDPNNINKTYSGLIVGHGLVFELTPLHLLSSTPLVERSNSGIRTNISGMTLRSISVKIHSTADIQHQVGEWALRVTPYWTSRARNIATALLYQHSFRSLTSLPGTRTAPVHRPITVRQNFPATSDCGKAHDLDQPFASIHVASVFSDSRSEPSADSEFFIEIAADYRIHYEYGTDSFKNYGFKSSNTSGILMQSTSGEFWYYGTHKFDADAPEDMCSIQLTEPDKLKKISSGSYSLSLSDMAID